MNSSWNCVYGKWGNNTKSRKHKTNVNTLTQWSLLTCKLNLPTQVGLLCFVFYINLGMATSAIVRRGSGGIIIQHSKA